MNRNDAYKIVTQLIKNPNLIKHHLAAEAAMIGLAKYFKDKGNSNINRSHIMKLD